MQEIGKIFGAINSYKESLDDKKPSKEMIANKNILKGIFAHSQLQQLFNQCLELNKDLFRDTHKYLVENQNFEDLTSFTRGQSPKSATISNSKSNTKSGSDGASVQSALSLQTPRDEIDEHGLNEVEEEASAGERVNAPARQIEAGIE